MQSKEDCPPRGLGHLWGLAGRGARGPEARYSVRDVAAAGVRVADLAGLEAVTLSAVAKELGLTTTALYRYVDTKDMLIELMVDTAIGDPPPLRGRTWTARTHAWTRELTRRYRAHPWLGAIAPSGVPLRPSVYAWTEALLLALDDAPQGIDEMRLAMLLDAVVRGYAGVGQSDTPPPTWLGPTVAERFPRLAGELGRDFSDVDAELDHAVSVILRGVAF